MGIGGGAVIAKCCYDGDQIIGEYKGSTLKRKFVYGPGIDEPLRQARGKLICMIDVARQTKQPTR